MQNNFSVLEHIRDLTERVRADIRPFGDGLSLDNYLIDEYFRLVACNSAAIRSQRNIEAYIELQRLVLDDILLGVTVNGETGKLYSSMMVYNASCTEEACSAALGIPYGGDGAEEHLRTHTGYGNGVSDLSLGDGVMELAAKDLETGELGTVVVGPRLEVKDYIDAGSAKERFAKDAETKTYHDSTHVIIHIIDSDSYCVAANKKTSKWYALSGMEGVKPPRRQVKLWMCEDGILGVRFR